MCIYIQKQSFAVKIVPLRKSPLSFEAFLIRGIKAAANKKRDSFLDNHGGDKTQLIRFKAELSSRNFIVTPYQTLQG